MSVIRSKTTLKQLADLDQNGVVISVVRIKRNLFEFIENFEIKKVYKSSLSCRKRIERMHKSLIVNNESQRI